MPLSQDLANLVNLIQDPTQKAAMESRLVALEEGGLRQADYDRKMNEGKASLAATKTQYDSEHQNWEQWYNRQKTTFDTTVTELENTQRERDELKAKVDSAVRTAGSGNGNGNGAAAQVDQTQLKSLVESELSGRKYVSATEVEATVKKVADGLLQQEREKFFKETLPASTEFTLAMQDVQWRHRDEFGKPLDRNAFSKYITENKIQVDGSKSMNDAYERFTDAQRREKELEKIREDIRKDERSKLNLPGTGAVPTSELGHMQQRLQGQKEGMPEILFKDNVSTRELAAAAANELRGEGKS